MVRRKSRRASEAIPSWVTAFMPNSWAGTTPMQQFRAWQTAVSDFCQANDLSKRDVATWLGVVRNVHTVKRHVGARYSSESDKS